MAWGFLLRLTKRLALTKLTTIAEMVELVDTQVSDACGGNPVEVQVLFSAINKYRKEAHGEKKAATYRNEYRHQLPGN